MSKKRKRRKDAKTTRGQKRKRKIKSKETRIKTLEIFSQKESKLKKKTFLSMESILIWKQNKRIN